MDKKLFNKADEFSRRKFVSNLAAGCLGVSFLSDNMSPSLNAATIPPLRKDAKAKSVIYLYMNGGMSHLDSFDVKPENKKVTGDAAALKTSADGVRVSNYFPKMAKQMHHTAVVNSMTSTQGAHTQGSYFTHTSYESRGTIEHPHMGSWVNYLAGNVHGTLPANVKIFPKKTLGSGWMPGKFSALPIGKPSEGVKYSSRHRNVSSQQFNNRLSVLSKMNQNFQEKHKHSSIKEYNNAYEDAVKLMSSKDLKAFDISGEKNRNSYGDSRFGEGCLLARRLVEHGVRWVEVNFNGWDHHDNIYDRFPENAATLDTALAGLVSDLKQRGLLDSTLIVLATEFGRKPIMNQRAGRDHFPSAYSQLLIGGGIQGGQLYGQTDKDGMKITKNKVKVPDFNATVAYALGLPLDHVVMSPTDRPFTVAGKGKPITSLF